MIMYYMHEYNGGYEYINAYKNLIMASWSTKCKKRANDLKEKAMHIFVEKVLFRIRTDFIQAADIFRQIKEFEGTELLLQAASSILDEDDPNYLTQKGIIEFEKNLIKQKDSNSHNLSELKNNENK